MGAGDINLIAKIAPKNDAFVGMVNANQVLGGVVGSTIPDNAIAESSILQHVVSGVYGISVSGTSPVYAVGSITFKPGTNVTITRAGSEFTFNSTGGAGGSSVYQHRWTANGPFQSGSDVDGVYISDTAFDIVGVWLWRGTAGTAGSTTIDLNANGTTLYSTQNNRPIIQFNDADKKVDCTLPDTVSISAGDIITIDIDGKEAGEPKDLILMIQG
jgi:hypothetical protein